MAYRNVRQFIISKGWTPTNEFQDEAITKNRSTDYPHPLLELGYEELGDCSGIGTPLCDFYFKHERTNKHIRIITYGEINHSSTQYTANVIYLRIFPDRNSLVENISENYYWSAIGGEEYNKTISQLKDILE